VSMTRRTATQPLKWFAPTHTENKVSNNSGRSPATPNGVRLGSPKIEIVREAAEAAIRAEADQRAQNVRPVIDAIRAAGVVKVRDIAAALNARGIATARGGRWHPSTVQNILART
jgi:hypothetical protein